MAVDLGSVIQALDEDPAQRAALRRALFGDVPDLMSALASLTDRVDELAQAQQRTEARLEGLIARVDDLAAAQRRTEQRVGELASWRVGELAEAQTRTEHSLNSLIDTVNAMNDKLGRLDGEISGAPLPREGPGVLLGHRSPSSPARQQHPERAGRRR